MVIRTQTLNNAIEIYKKISIKLSLRDFSVKVVPSKYKNKTQTMGTITIPNLTLASKTKG